MKNAVWAQRSQLIHLGHESGVNKASFRCCQDLRPSQKSQKTDISHESAYQMVLFMVPCRGEWRGKAGTLENWA